MAEETPKITMLAKVKKFILGASVGFVLFIIAIFALAFMSTRGVADVANAYINDLQAGACGTIYENVTEEFSDNVSEEEWTANCERLATFLTGEAVQKNVVVEKSNTGDSRGVASYEILGTDEVTYEVTLLLLKEDGWKLANLDSTPVETTTEE